MWGFVIFPDLLLNWSIVLQVLLLDVMFSQFNGSRETGMSPWNHEYIWVILFTLCCAVAIPEQPDFLVSVHSEVISIGRTQLGLTPSSIWQNYDVPVIISLLL